MKPAANTAAPGTNYLIRADASAQMGSGHIMRCLTLAADLRPHGDVLFACAHLPAPLRQRIVDQGHGVLDLPASDDLDVFLPAARQARAVIVDSYVLGAEWRRAVADCGRPILAVDDLCDHDLYADVVLNAAPAAFDMPYDQRAKGATLLLGPSYALVSPEIRHWRDQPPGGADGHLLLTFGGSDPLGLTLPVARHLSHLPLLAVLGGAVPDVDRVAGQLRDLGARVEINTPQMGQWIRQSRLVVTAGGSTLNEIAVLARPALVVVVADNQIPGSRRAAADGWVFCLDGRGQDAADRIAALALRLWDDGGRLDALAAAAGRQTDGLGGQRVVQVLLSRPD